MAQPKQDIRIGIDVGGTFTDFVVVQDGGASPQYLKEASTPSDPSEAVMSGVQRILAGGIHADAIRSITHGTTIGLNSIIQRRGAVSGLVITEGHRDVLELTRRLPEEYNLRQPHPDALIPRSSVVEISARLDSHGDVVTAPSEDELERVARKLQRIGAESVAVTVLHSYLNPEFEAEIAQQLQQRLPGVTVTGSASIWPEIREYNRTSVGVLNAYVAPLMKRYLSNLRQRLDSLGVKCPLFITASNGGSLGIESAAERAVDTILSGPASGVTATLILAKRANLERVISFDMGGTSSDIAVATEGEADFSTRAEVGGIPLILPVVDVSAIGAGGGSIARVDAQGRLQVGPESAGATPGPAAYGMGGDMPTITDAYLVNGILAADRFLGGEKQLDTEAARSVLAKIVDGLSLSGEDNLQLAAESVLTLATVAMAAELEKVMSRRGYDAKEFTLVPFGGAGPTHAAFLAEEVGIQRIVIPLAAGTYCALGAVGAPLRRDYLRGIARPLTSEVAQLASDHLKLLLEEGQAWVLEQGDLVETVTLDASLDMRYAGQAFELSIPVNDEDLPFRPEIIEERFHAEHERLFGHRDAIHAVQLVAARLTAVGTVPSVDLGDAAATVGVSSKRAATSRPVFFDGAWHDAKELSTDDVFTAPVAGPAVLDLQHTTIFIPPAWTATTSAGNSITLTYTAEHPRKAS